MEDIDREEFEKHYADVNNLIIPDWSLYRDGEFYQAGLVTLNGAWIAWQKVATRCEAIIGDLKRERDALRSQLIDIVRVLGRDIPDCIDNDGQPYQSQSFSEWIDSQEVQPNER